MSLSLAAMTLAAPAAAQVVAPGTSGIFAWVQRSTNAAGPVTDQLIVALPALIAAGSPLLPGPITLGGFATSGNLPPPAVIGPFPLFNRVTPSMNRRSQLAPRETEILFVAPGIVFVPTVDVQGRGAVDVFDFRLTLNPTVTPLLLPGTPGPYDLLLDAANQTVYASANTANGVVVQAISYAGNAIALGGTSITTPFAASNFATRMVLDPSTNNVLVPTVGAIEAFATPALAPNTQTLIRAGQTLATEIKSLAGGASGVLPRPGVAQRFIIGTSSAANGAGWQVSDAVDAQVSFGNFGFVPGAAIPWRFSFGFQDVGVGPSNLLGAAAATFLLEDPRFAPVGPGAIAQVRNGGSGPAATLAASLGAPVVIPAGTPFNNPTDGEPSAFYISGGPIDSVGLTGTGAASSASAGTGFVSTATLPVGALVSPSATESPLLMPGGVIGASATAVGNTVSGMILLTSAPPVIGTPALIGAALPSVLATPGSLAVSQPIMPAGVPAFAQIYTSAATTESVYGAVNFVNGPVLTVNQASSSIPQTAIPVGAPFVPPAPPAFPAAPNTVRPVLPALSSDPAGFLHLAYCVQSAPGPVIATSTLLMHVGLSAAPLMIQTGAQIVTEIAGI